VEIFNITLVEIFEVFGLVWYITMMVRSSLSDISQERFLVL